MSEDKLIADETSIEKFGMSEEIKNIINCDFGGYIARFNEDSSDKSQDFYRELHHTFLRLVNNFWEDITIGTCYTEVRKDGCYAYCTLNDTVKAKECWDDINNGEEHDVTFNINSNGIIRIMVSDTPLIQPGNEIDYIRNSDEDEWEGETLQVIKTPAPQEVHFKVLGTEYVIEIHEISEHHPKLEENTGVCDYHAKKILLLNPVKDDLSFEDLDSYKRRVARHEIIHAFLAESGLRRSCSWAENEEVVDWIAIQFPKMLKAFQEAGVITEDDINL